MADVRRENLLLIAAALVGVGSAGVQASQVRDLLGGGPDDFDPRECEGLSDRGGVLRGVRYLEQMRGGAEPGDAVPMVVLFHSKGATPEGHVNMLKRSGPSRLIVPEGALSTRSGSGRLWWDLGIKAAMEEDPIAAAAQWRAAAARIHRFLQALVRCRPTVGKPILTGSSMGGQMAYLMGTRYMDHAYASVSVNGYLIDSLWSPHMVPTLSLHGIDDTVVPYQWDKEYVEAMQARGAPIRMESFDAGHSLTSTMARAWGDSIQSLVRSASAGEPPDFGVFA